jgi:hypothetical protein
MKKILLFIIAISVVLGIFYFVNKKEVSAPAVVSSTVRVNIENYLKDNIAELSPTKPVLGGTWYIVSVTLNLEKNSGFVVYEDGHIQEERNFSYTVNEKGEVLDLKIK